MGIEREGRGTGRRGEGCRGPRGVEGKMCVASVGHYTNEQDGYKE